MKISSNQLGKTLAQTIESACNVGDLGLIPGLGRSPGEGNGNLLQYSCPGNPMDGGAWQAAVHGIIKSWTWLSNWKIYTVSDIQSEITGQAKSQAKNTTHNEKSLFSDLMKYDKSPYSLTYLICLLWHGKLPSGEAHMAKSGGSLSSMALSGLGPANTHRREVVNRPSFAEPEMITALTYPVVVSWEDPNPEDPAKYLHFWYPKPQNYNFLTIYLSLFFFFKENWLLSSGDG